MGAKKTYVSSIEQELRSDTMEAYRVFQTARSVFFYLILLGLLILAVVFWVVDAGCINDTLTQELRPKKSEVISFNGLTKGLMWFLAEETPAASADAPASEPAEEGSKTLKITRPDDGTERLEKRAELPMPDGDPGLAPTDHAGDLRKLLEVLTIISTYGLAFGVVCYAIALLIGLQLMLIGRLGGMCDGAKSFFLSLVVFVLIFPWQKVVGGEISGVVFSFSDLIRRYVAKNQEVDFVQIVYYYGRFVGLWILALLLLLATQWRSRMAGQMIELRAHFGRHVQLEEEPTDILEDNSRTLSNLAD